MRELRLKVHCFFREYPTSIRVYSSVRSLRAACTQWDIHHEGDWDSSSDSVGRATIDKKNRAYVFLCEEKLGAGYVAHEFAHLVDFMTPLTVYALLGTGLRAVSYGDRRSNDSIDALEERAWVLGALCADFWEWWLSPIDRRSFASRNSSFTIHPQPTQGAEND